MRRQYELSPRIGYARYARLRHQANIDAPQQGLEERFWFDRIAVLGIARCAPPLGHLHLLYGAC